MDERDKKQALIMVCIDKNKARCVPRMKKALKMQQKPWMKRDTNVQGFDHGRMYRQNKARQTMDEKALKCNKSHG